MQKDNRILTTEYGSDWMGPGKKTPPDMCTRLHHDLLLSML